MKNCGPMSNTGKKMTRVVGKYRPLPPDQQPLAQRIGSYKSRRKSTRHARGVK